MFAALSNSPLGGKLSTEHATRRRLRFVLHLPLGEFTRPELPVPATHPRSLGHWDHRENAESQSWQPVPPETQKSTIQPKVDNSARKSASIDRCGYLLEGWHIIPQINLWLARTAGGSQKPAVYVDAKRFDNLGTSTQLALILPSKPSLSQFPREMPTFTCSFHRRAELLWNPHRSCYSIWGCQPSAGGTFWARQQPTTIFWLPHPPNSPPDPRRRFVLLAEVIPADELGYLCDAKLVEYKNTYLSPFTSLLSIPIQYNYLGCIRVNVIASIIVRRSFHILNSV